MRTWNISYIISYIFVGAFLTVSVLGGIAYFYNDNLHDPIHVFYGMALTLFTGFAGIALIIVRNYTIRNLELRYWEKTDIGALGIIGAILCWQISVVCFMYMNEDARTYQGIAQILSTLNSGGFLFSTKYFTFEEQDKPSWWDWYGLTWLRKGRNIWILTAVVLCLDILLFFVFQLSRFYAAIPDFLFGLVTIFLLLLSMNSAFSVRGLPKMNYLVGFTLAITFYGQLFPFIDTSVSHDLLMGLFYRVFLIVLFFGLILSWYGYNKMRAEKKMRREMNHAIRSGLRALRLDLKQVAKENHRENDEVLQNFQKRVEHLSKIHNHIHESREQGVDIGLRAYLEDLTSDIQLFHETDAYSVKIDLPENWKLDPEATKDIGQIVLEIALNAHKAFGNQLDKRLEVLAEVDSTADDLVLFIKDNGPGLHTSPKDFNFGLKNLHDTVEDWFGIIDIRLPKEGGTEFMIRLPLAKLKPIVNL